MPGSRVVHRAEATGGRMPPAARDSGGPEGRLKTSLPLYGFHKPSPHEAGVGLACPTALCEPQDAASTRDPTVTERPSAPTSILRLRRHGGRRSVGRINDGLSPPTFTRLKPDIPVGVQVFLNQGTDAMKLESAVKLYRRVRAPQPENAGVREDLSRTLHELSKLEAGEGQAGKARGYVEQALNLLNEGGRSAAGEKLRETLEAELARDGDSDS